eukprot:SAG11_NODE_1102_length_5866_cov_2.173574_2_plen_258_part_00
MALTVSKDHTSHIYSLEPILCPHTPTRLSCASAGENPVLAGAAEGTEIRSRTVKAMTECKLCYLIKEDLTQLMAEYPAFAFRVRRFRNIGKARNVRNLARLGSKSLAPDELQKIHHHIRATSPRFQKIGRKVLMQNRGIRALQSSSEAAQPLEVPIEGVAERPEGVGAAESDSLKPLKLAKQKPFSDPDKLKQEAEKVPAATPTVLPALLGSDFFSALDASMSRLLASHTEQMTSALDKLRDEITELKQDRGDSDGR